MGEENYFKIEDLRELTKRMKNVEADAPKLWREAFKPIIMPLRDRVRQKAKSQPKVTPKAARSVATPPARRLASERMNPINNVLFTASPPLQAEGSLA